MDTDEFDPAVARVLRPLVPRVVGALVRRYGDFGDAEDAVQEAVLQAVVAWRERGIPEQPDGWLVRAASRRLIDLRRADTARRRREETEAVQRPPEPDAAGAVDNAGEVPTDADDTLRLLLLCCHPALGSTSQIALTLRAVGGLTTREIAAALLVPESTVAQRISRAKAAIRASGARFATPDADPEAEGRIRAVLVVLYLIFTEGYAASGGERLQRPGLTVEAVRLVRELRAQRPADDEVAGLLALMLLLDARSAARTDAVGELVPLAEQDPSRWDRAMIAEGVEIISGTLRRSAAGPGPYQVQAAIAAVHAESTDRESTDWPQVLLLYQLLERLSPTPAVQLNHAVALAMVRGPAAGLARLDALASDRHVGSHHRLFAVRAHLLESAGESAAAVDAYRRAAAITASLPEQRYLHERAERLRGSGMV